MRLLSVAVLLACGTSSAPAPPDVVRVSSHGAPCPDLGKPPYTLEPGLCVEAEVIDVGQCGSAHSISGHCAQVRAFMPWGGAQFTVVTDERMFEDGDRVSVVLEQEAPEANRTLLVDGVWLTTWVEPWRARLNEP